ncbi:MAG: hypothetical protein MUF19_02070 [Candidatus Pacebacteria bacterium]|nr:hypothetical protein [Candidatus Paceibacterota bacterium]
MAFENFKGLFRKSEQAPLPKDIIGTLSQEHRDTLDMIRNAYRENQGKDLTGEQIGALSYVREGLESKYGPAAAKQAISEYVKAASESDIVVSEADIAVSESDISAPESATALESRLGELKDIYARNSFLKTVLMKSLASGDKASIDRAKSSLSVLSRDTFSAADVEALCAEVMNSDEYQEYILARVKQETAAVTTSSQAEAAPTTPPIAPVTQEKREFVPNLPKELDPGNPQFAPIEKSSQVPQVPDPRI